MLDCAGGKPSFVLGLVIRTDFIPYDTTISYINTKRIHLINNYFNKNETFL